MKFNLKSIILYVFFLALGIALFIYSYKDYDIEEFKNVVKETNYYWLLLSLVLGIFSHYVRAIRWNMLIKPLGHSPKVANSFIAVLVTYCVNILLPRAGEVARCGVLAKYEKVSFTPLVGTVVVERTADVIVLGIISVFVVTFYNADILAFFNLNEGGLRSVGDIVTPKLILMAVAALAVLAIIVYILLKNKKISAKINELKSSFVDGLKTIVNLKHKWLFIFYSFFIYILYLVMLYFVFFAYPPTSHLTLHQGIVTFFLSALAMLAPIQAGVGAWHTMVILTLSIYGISETIGQNFALLAHSSTNLIYLFIGFIAYLFLPLVNKKSIIEE